MHLGSSWYPEHWPEARWARDLALMQQAGFTVVRVGEFAWSTLEPRENVFELDWLERAVNLAQAHGLEVVIGTPTSTPPAWLTRAYPEVLPVSESGVRAAHGRRGHFNPGSPTYHRLCRAIVSRLAERFGAHPAVIGWQLDNECWAISYDARTEKQFQDWLRKRYLSLEQLNARWVTAYWSQTYTEWTQIPLPKRAPGEEPQHPSLELEWRRFRTEVYRGYFLGQIDALREHAGKRQWITHNYFDIGTLDRQQLSEVLDLASYDAYVGQGHLRPWKTGLEFDFVRGLKRKNFWLMETQPGHVNWAGVNTDLEPGEVRSLCWHAVGHGADAVLFWQWRSALGGQEQYHGCLLAPDGEPRPIYAEVAELGREWAALSPLFKDSEPHSEVAILDCAQDRWALDLQRHHQDYSAVHNLSAFYTPLRQRGLNVDVVSPDAPLEGYKLVIAPNLHLLEHELAERLRVYALQGHLVLGPRVGVKTPDNAWWPLRGPGLLAPALGAHVEESYVLPDSVALEGVWGQGEARLWGEWLAVDSPEAEVLARYGTGHGWLEGKAAAVSHPQGAGRLTLLGTWPDAGTMQNAVGWMLEASGLEVPSPLPEGLELCRRTKPGLELLIMLNHNSQTLEVSLPEVWQDGVNGEDTTGALVLPGRGVRVLSRAITTELGIEGMEMRDR